MLGITISEKTLKFISFLFIIIACLLSIYLVFNIKSVCPAYIKVIHIDDTNKQIIGYCHFTKSYNDYTINCTNSRYIRDNESESIYYYYNLINISSSDKNNIPYLKTI